MQELANDAQLDQESVRLMAKSSYGTHWAAIDAAGDICLITLVEDESVWGLNCMPRPAFYANGASLRVAGSPDSGTVAHLLPPGLNEAAVQDAVGTHESAARNTSGADAGGEVSGVEIFADSGLIVLDADIAAALGTVHIPRDGQEDLVLSDLGS